MKKQNKIYLGIGIIAIVIIVAIMMFSNQKGEETIKIGNLPITHGLPLYVAIEKGYFEEAGINVEFVPFETPNQLMDAILNGNLDFTGPGFALGISAIVNERNPEKFKAYAISGDSEGMSGAKFIIPIDSEIESIEDLKGKKVGILAGTIQWQVIAREILEKNGLDMDNDVTIIELSQSLKLQAITSKQVDALLAIEPVSTIAINTGVAKILSENPLRDFITDPFYYGVGIVNTDFMKKNPEITEKIITVLRKTIHEINENPDDYRIYLKGYTPLSDELINKVPSVKFKMCEDINLDDQESVQKFFDLFIKYDVIEKIDKEQLFMCDLR